MDLPSPDQQPKEMVKIMILEEVRANEKVLNEYVCRGIHS